MTKINNVLPCPFCGNIPWKFQLPSGTWTIECHGEKCRFNPSSPFSYEREEMAIKEWNTRCNPGPDWTTYQSGREDGLMEAAEFCLDHIKYADSTMSNEELLNFVASSIKRL
jgi:hypothetical protein